MAVIIYSIAAVFQDGLAAQPTPTAKSHSLRFVAITVVVVVVALGLVVASGLLGLVGGPGGSGLPITTLTTSSGDSFSDFPVDAGHYSASQFAVPSGAFDVFVSGNLTASGGADNAIRVYFFDNTSFVNWEKGDQVTAYFTAQQTRFHLRVSLPNGPGTYYIVFDNTFSASSSKTVTGYVSVNYSVPYP